MTKFNICGVLVHAIKDKKYQVETVLDKTSGVEVHANTDDGKLVVTVESENNSYVADTISKFQDIDGVLSASMIYQFSDDANTTTQGVPE